jgi:hypothetical protein
MRLDVGTSACPLGDLITIANYLSRSEVFN